MAGMRQLSGVERIRTVVALRYRTVSADPERAILAASKDQDLIVLGISVSGLRRFGLTSVVESVAKKTDVPIAVVNSPRKVESFVKRVVWRCLTHDPLPREPPSVHSDGEAGYIVRGTRRQENHGSCHVFRSAPPAGGDPPEKLLAAHRIIP